MIDVVLGIGGGEPLENNTLALQISVPIIHIIGDEGQDEGRVFEGMFALAKPDKGGWGDLINTTIPLISIKRQT